MKQNKRNSRIIGIGLFSGCGGLDLGAYYAGVDIVYSNDIRKDGIETMKLNKKYFKNGTKEVGDICDIETSEIKEIIKKEKADKVIVIGGPPCQPFSKAGYRVTNKKRDSAKDPRNMLLQYIRIINEIQPDGFVFENVESILHPSNIETFKGFLGEIEKIGYHFAYKKILAADYGIPQKRKRVFVVGSKKEVTTEFPNRTHCEGKKANETGLKSYEGVGKYLSDFSGKEYFEEYESTVGKTYEKELKKVPMGKNYLALEEMKGKKRFWSFLLKLHPDLPSWTILAQPGPRVGPFHWENRRLRVPEIAALQTFPKDYKFYGTRRSIQKQIGNAVPPELGKLVVEYLLENI